jgi:hypothetical protein
MTKNLVSQTSIFPRPNDDTGKGFISERCQDSEATCHAAKDHAVPRRKWDYSFYVD